jgi:hypothetical protein
MTDLLAPNVETTARRLGPLIAMQWFGLAIVICGLGTLCISCGNDRPLPQPNQPTLVAMAEASPVELKVVAAPEPPPPAPEPEPIVTPPPAPVPLALQIVAPNTADAGDFIHVELKVTGEAREFAFTIEKRGSAEPVPASNIIIDQVDPRKFIFAGKEGVYTIRAYAIGATQGMKEAEHRLQVREPYQPPPPRVEPVEPQSPADLLRMAALDVHSDNRDIELLEIAKAGHEVAADIKNGRLAPARAAKEWANKAYLRLGRTVFQAWNESETGPSFFGRLKQLIDDSVEAAKAAKQEPNIANLVDNLSSLMEGK